MGTWLSTLLALRPVRVPAALPPINGATGRAQAGVEACKEAAMRGCFG